MPFKNNIAQRTWRYKNMTTEALKGILARHEDAVVVIREILEEREKEK